MHSHILRLDPGPVWYKGEDITVLSSGGFRFDYSQFKGLDWKGRKQPLSRQRNMLACPCVCVCVRAFACGHLVDVAACAALVWDHLVLDQSGWLIERALLEYDVKGST